MTKAAYDHIHSASLSALRQIYADVWRDNDTDVIRDFILNDRFFLLTQVLGVDVAFHPWVLERCREVEADPDEHLDLWSRGHFKSTIITFAGTTQYVLANPENCVCIISCKAGAAETFAAQIKTAFETNEILLKCFPDILFSNTPDHKGTQWSVSDFCVKRKTARKESTVATSGLVSGMRTGGHYDLLVYDDVVTPDSVITPEMSQRTTDSWMMSLNLGSDGSDGSTKTKHWYIGTRYAIYDTYAEMIARGIPERRHVAIDTDGEPVYWTKQVLEQKRREMDSKTWSSQILQVPIGSGELYFQAEWWRFYTNQPDSSRMHRYIFVDTATKRGKRNDYSVFFVVGLARDQNYYVLDIVRDKLSLSQRADTFLELCDKWQPINVFWEANGSRSDAEYLAERMEREGVSYRITEIEQTSRYGSKEDRIRWLEPIFREGKILFPTRLLYKPVNDNRLVDLVRAFYEEEYTIMPSVNHDDMLDCLANIRNPDIIRNKQVTFPVGSSEALQASYKQKNTATFSRHKSRFDRF